MRCKSWLAFSPYPNTYINLEYAFYKKHYVSLRLNIAKKYAGCFQQWSIINIMYVLGYRNW